MEVQSCPLFPCPSPILIKHPFILTVQRPFPENLGTAIQLQWSGTARHRALPHVCTATETWGSHSASWLQVRVVHDLPRQELWLQDTDRIQFWQKNGWRKPELCVATPFSRDRLIYFPSSYQRGKKAHSHWRLGPLLTISWDNPSVSLCQCLWDDSNLFRLKVCLQCRLGHSLLQTKAIKMR